MFHVGTIYYTISRTKYRARVLMIFFSLSGNVEIGNGYGVPGGGAYYGAPRTPMFTLASESNDHTLEGHNTSSKATLDGRVSPVHPSELSSDRGFKVGPKKDSMMVEAHFSKESQMQRKELPELLKQRLKARGLLKETNTTDSATHDASVFIFPLFLFFSSFLRHNI